MPASSSAQRSSHFELLHESIRHWIWQQGWDWALPEELRLATYLPSALDVAGARVVHH